MKKRIFELVLFAMFGTIMMISDIIMDLLPNVHLLAMFIITFTVVYRSKALVPIYTYVFLNGLIYGFGSTWMPNLYIWTVLWALAMLVPRSLNPYFSAVIYIALGALHGIAFGMLYAPVQIIMFYGGAWEYYWPWVITGFPFDVIHCIGNACACTLTVPLITLLRKLPGAVPVKSKKGLSKGK